MSLERKIHVLCCEGQNMGWVETRLVSLADGCAAFKSTFSDGKREQVVADATEVREGEALMWKLDGAFSGRALDGGMVSFDLRHMDKDQIMMTASISERDVSLWTSSRYPLCVNDSIGIRVAEVVWPGEEIAS